MKKVLLIKLSSLGDVIFTVPLANNLKDNGYVVHCLTTEKGIDIMQNNPCVDKVFFMPLYTWRKNIFDIKSLFKILKLFYDLRKEKYDMAFDCQRRIKSLPFMRFCGAKRRIISYGAREGSHLGANEFVPPIGKKTHMVRWNLDYAKYLGYDISNIKFSLPEQSEEVKNKVDDLIKDLDFSRPIVVIAPATTWEPKHWKLENWKTVAESLKDRANLVFTGTNKDNDMICNIMPKNNCLNLAGKTNLHDLMYLYSKADIVIAPDSGSAHLAWASERPAVIEIFCCTDYKYFGCYGNEEKCFPLHSNISCYPCNKRHCPKSENINECTNAVKPEEVIKIANDILDTQLNSKS